MCGVGLRRWPLKNVLRESVSGSGCGGLGRGGGAGATATVRVISGGDTRILSSAPENYRPSDGKLCCGNGDEIHDLGICVEGIVAVDEVEQAGIRREEIARYRRVSDFCPLKSAFAGEADPPALQFCEEFVDIVGYSVGQLECFRCGRLGKPGECEFVAFEEYFVDILLGDFSVWADEKRAASTAGEGAEPTRDLLDCGGGRAGRVRHSLILDSVVGTWTVAATVAARRTWPSERVVSITVTSLRAVDVGRRGADLSLRFTPKSGQWSRGHRGRGQ